MFINFFKKELNLKYKNEIKNKKQLNLWQIWFLFLLSFIMFLSLILILIDLPIIGLLIGPFFVLLVFWKFNKNIFN